MKSIERRYKSIEAKKNFWSSFACFAEAVNGQHFGKQCISHWFGKLVEKDDFARCDKRQILKHLEGLSNRAEDNQK